MDAIYARQSVDKADSLSIQGQIDLCRQKAGAGFQVYHDRGYSGRNTNRPAFQRMMEDVEKGLVQKIIVYRLDRFSRSIADFGRLWETLRRHNVEFVSINETFDTSTPMGRAMLNIIMVFAQLERETTAERVRDNYYQRAKLGAWPGGPAPYGFSIGRLPGPDGKPLPGLVPNGDAAALAEHNRFRQAAGGDMGNHHVIPLQCMGDGYPHRQRGQSRGPLLLPLDHIQEITWRDIPVFYQGESCFLDCLPPVLGCDIQPHTPHIQRYVMTDFHTILLPIVSRMALARSLTSHLLTLLKRAV